MSLIIKGIIGLVLTGGIVSAVVFVPKLEFKDTPVIHEVKPEVKSENVEVEPVITVIEPELVGETVNEEVKVETNPSVKSTLAPQVQTPKIDNSQLLAEQQKLAELEAGNRILEEALRQKLEREAKEKSIIEQRARDEVDRIKEETRKTQALIKQIQTECENPINQWNQEILTIKSEYYATLDSINKRPGNSKIQLYAEVNELTKQSNLKINTINTKIEQKTLECSIKYGG